MSRISKLERSEVTLEMSALYDKILRSAAMYPTCSAPWRTGQRFSPP
jgi:hypothetical protein